MLWSVLQLFIYPSIHMDLFNKASTLLLGGLSIEVFKTQRVWDTSSLTYPPNTREWTCFNTTPSRRTLQLYAVFNPEWNTIKFTLVIHINKCSRLNICSIHGACLFADHDLKWWLKNPTQGYCCRKLLLATICSSSRFFFLNQH